MLNKPFFLAVLAYFFVLQFVVVGLMREDTRYFTLAGVNLIAILIFSFCSREKVQKSDPKLMHAFVREKSRYEEEVSEPEMLKAEPSLSESNIEQIKIKINKTKPRSQKATSAWYRFFLFLFALLGCV